MTALVDLAVRSPANSLEREIYCRSGCVLFYSHWEGYAKRAADYYLEHVSLQRVKIDEMSEFVAVLYVQQIMGGANDLSHERIMSVFNKLVRSPGLQPRISWKKVVDTQANLSSKVLKNISGVIGIDFTAFDRYTMKLDHLVLRSRNAICHGAKGEVDVDALEEMKETIQSLIDILRNQIENAIQLELYKI